MGASSRTQGSVWGSLPPALRPGQTSLIHPRAPPTEPSMASKAFPAQCSRQSGLGTGMDREPLPSQGQGEHRFQTEQLGRAQVCPDYLGHPQWLENPAASIF